MTSFELFQVLYLVLDDINSDIHNDNLIEYLTDSNPYMRNGKNSVDVTVYHDFDKKFNLSKDNDDYYYNFVCDYLKNIEYYKNLYNIFKSNLSKDEYIDNVKYILENKEEYLKK